MPINYNALTPPPEGDLPPFWKPEKAGEAVEGVIVDTRIVGHSEYGDAPCLDIQQADGTVVPVLGSTNSLYKQIYSARPEVGGMVRITFQGYSGKAKLFRLDYAPPAGAPAQQAPAPAAAPQPAPQGFAPPAAAPAAPWANQPAGPAPAPAAPPWGS